MTDKAIKALNGLEIGEKKIKMQRVSNDAPDNFADEEEQAKAKKGGRLKPSNAVKSIKKFHKFREDLS